MLQVISTSTQATMSALYPLYAGGQGAALACVRVADAGLCQHSEGETW